MDNIHKILNYSFTPLDLINYVGQFISGRHEDMERLSVVRPCKNIAYKTPEELARIVCEFYFEEPVTSITSTSGFDTYELLGSIMQEVSKGKALNPEFSNIINMLQKRFEVNHRIFEHYNQDIQKNGDSFQDIRIYALLSIVLSVRYLINRNINDLNTSIKLNDVVMKSGWMFDVKYNQLLSISLCIEQKIVEELNGK